MTKFITGSFDDVDIKKIDVLIMVNFIHGIPYQELETAIKGLLSRCNVKMFIFDTFENNKNTEYLYSHDGKRLFGENYYMLNRSKGYPAAHGVIRHIEYWRRSK